MERYNFFSSGFDWSILLIWLKRLANLSYDKLLRISPNELSSFTENYKLDPNMTLIINTIIGSGKGESELKPIISQLRKLSKNEGIDVKAIKSYAVGLLNLFKRK